MTVEEVVVELMERGLVRAQAERAMWMARDRGVIHLLQTAQMLEEQEVQGSVPSEVIRDVVLQSVHPGVVSTSPVVGKIPVPGTLHVFRQIIALANEQLLVASPYIDHGGVARLKASIISATRRGVRLRLLTRESSRRDRNRTLGLKLLHDIMGDLLEVRDYHFEVAGRHQTSLHAKLLMADGLIAYVGSAELRRNALANNFELGVVLHSPETTTARQMFETFWTVAKEVRGL